MATAEELGVEDVYDLLTNTYGLEGTVSKGKFNMTCPSPDHKDSNPSCDVRLSDGKWNCFSCPAFGDLVDLGAIVLKERKGTIFKMLRPDDPDARRKALQRRLEVRRKAAKPLRSTTSHHKIQMPPYGSYEDGPMDFLTDRGFNLKTIRKWGVRHADRVTLFNEDSEPFELANAIAIPILSEKGEMLAWCYRATPRSQRWFQQVRYIYTPGVTDRLNHNWFGAHIHNDLQEIGIVEGALDTMWMDQHGLPAWGILGSQVKQLPKIRKLMVFRKVVIMPDHDSAGVMTTLALGTALQQRGVGVSVGRYRSWMLSPKGVPAADPQDLCGLDLELVYARAINFPLWRRRDHIRAA